MGTSAFFIVKSTILTVVMLNSLPVSSFAHFLRFWTLLAVILQAESLCWWLENMPTVKMNPGVYSTMIGAPIQVFLVGML